MMAIPKVPAGSPIRYIKDLTKRFFQLQVSESNPSVLRASDDTLYKYDEMGCLRRLSPKSPSKKSRCKLRISLGRQYHPDYHKMTRSQRDQLTNPMNVKQVLV